MYYGEDEDNMISSSKQDQVHWAGSVSSQFPPRNKHLRYRTRVFAAEYVCFFILCTFLFFLFFLLLSRPICYEMSINFLLLLQMFSFCVKTDALAMYQLQLEQNLLILTSCWQGAQYLKRLICQMIG